MPRPAPRPGLNSETQRAKFLAAARRHYFGYGSALRTCGATTRAGSPCRRVALRGEDRCPVHTGREHASERRVRLLERQARRDATPEQAARAARRFAANRMRRLWRRDPWVPGSTIDLGEAEDAMRSALRAAGQPLRLIPPMVLDWLRWRWRRAFLDGRQEPRIWGAALRRTPERMSAAGPPPRGWDPAWMPPASGLAYTADQPQPRSKRRVPNVPKRPAAASVMPPLGELSPEESAPAARALAFYGDKLAPLLRPLLTQEARFHLALAFDRCAEGEMDHEEWRETLEALAGK
jgi:hypothetical protein